MKPTLTLLTALLLAPLAALHPADSAAAVPVRSIPAASWQVVQKPSVTSAGTCVAEGNIVKLAWQENVAAECEIKPLVLNRLYTLDEESEIPGIVPAVLALAKDPAAAKARAMRARAFVQQRQRETMQALTKSL